MCGVQSPMRCAALPDLRLLTHRDFREPVEIRHFLLSAEAQKNGRGSENHARFEERICRLCATATACEDDETANHQSD